MSIGRIIMIIGAILLVGGALYQYAPWLFSWFGRLPGDIRIEGERGFFFMPITSMILISIILSLLGAFFRR